MSALFEGDWTDAPRECDGDVRPADQTVLCDKCGMNLWHTPAGEEDGRWPTWHERTNADDEEFDVFFAIHKKDVVTDDEAKP